MSRSSSTATGVLYPVLLTATLCGGGACSSTTVGAGGDTDASTEASDGTGGEPGSSDGGAADSRGPMRRDSGSADSGGPAGRDSGSADSGGPAGRDAGQCDCDDGNPCRTGTCGGAACVYVDVEGPCDDGLFCNGPDACSNGSCSVHLGSPCLGDTVCDEAIGTCTGCISDTDCPDESVSQWSTCSYPDPCSETGSRERIRTRYTCEFGTCAPSSVPENEACPRTTDGSPCEGDGNECTRSVCEDGACVHSALTDGSPCEPDGDQCTDDQCMGGACAHPPRREGSQCSAEGPTGPDHLCCAGECRDTDDDNDHCGGCYVPCAVGTCTEGYCRGCETGQDCPAWVGPDFTCNTGPIPTRCQCFGECPKTWQSCTAAPDRKCRGVGPPYSD